VLLRAATPATLLIATDSGALHLHDLRAPRGALAPARAHATHFPNDDYVSSLTPLGGAAATDGDGARQWASTGGTTLAVTDLRRGVLERSDAQDDELLSGCAVRGVPRRRRRRQREAGGKNGAGEPSSSSDTTLVVGDGSGVITLWHGDGGRWADQSDRLVLSRGLRGFDAAAGGGESVECLANVPPGIGGSSGGGGGGGRLLAAGLGDGTVALVHVGGANRVVGALRHDEAETVVALGFDVAGRMVSGGGPVVKIWQEVMAVEESADEQVEEEQEESSDDDGDEESESEEEPVHERPRKKRRQAGPGQGVFSGLD
jgi:hypothetical protein